MKWIAVIVVLLALVFTPAHAPAQDKVYTWIDENGVVRYTNTLPPKGATIIDSEKEIPHNAEKDRQREIEQRRFLEKLKEEDQAPDRDEAADRQGSPKDSKQTASDQERKAEQDGDDRNRRNETYHQNQIERRRARELREQKFGE